MARGGARPGAGRKPKPGIRPVVSPAATQRAVGVLVDYVPADQLQLVNDRLKGTPLEVVSALAEMPLPDKLTPEQERWERSFRLECRKIAMPYLHPRLAAVPHETAPAPNAQIGHYKKPEVEGEQSSGLELARRIAFALAVGHLKAKEAA